MSLHVNTIDMSTNPLTSVYLGHLDNSHYIPLCPMDKLNQDEKPIKIHLDSQQEFFKWRTTIQNEQDAVNSDILIEQNELQSIDSNEFTKSNE